MPLQVSQNCTPSYAATSLLTQRQLDICDSYNAFKGITLLYTKLCSHQFAHSEAIKY